jgi:glutamate-ammonia-ligase adenylyltransferase
MSKRMASQFQYDASALPTSVQFDNPDSAKRSLAHIRQRTPADVYSLLLTFLPAVPDADCALSQFERLVDCAEPRLFERFRQFPFLVHYAVQLFGHSKWIGETLIRNRDIFDEFVSQRNALHRPTSHEDFAARLRSVLADSPHHDFGTLLANFKCRQYAAIILRDVLGLASFSDVTGEISCLSDVLIETALREAERQLDSRAERIAGSRFAVISLGKLGGNELNYSSDIDLLFLYDGSQTSREYFIRLAQAATDLLSRRTPEGTVFRIDLRLRPQGSQEELAVSLPHAIRYYRHVAQDWELQALIKARHSAGDAPVTREFLRAVESQVYRPGLNFSAIKTALLSREKMDKQRLRRHQTPAAFKGVDVKLDHGGIRDIEFLVQCLQRVYGGQEFWLRSRGTLFAMQKLHDKQHLSGRDFHDLNDAYIFLRMIEHRLQLREGRQTHRLLQSPHELELMARSMAPEGTAIPEGQAFLAQVRARMKLVAEIYDRVVMRKNVVAEERLDQKSHTGAPACSNHNREVMNWLPHHGAGLRDELTETPLSRHARLNLERVLSAVGTLPESSSLGLRSTGTLRGLRYVVERSDLITAMLARDPRDLALLNELVSEGAEAGAEPLNIQQLSFELDSDAPPVDALAALRRSCRRAMFLSCSRDVMRMPNVYAALQEKTCIADAAIRAAMTMAGALSGFAVMALGRLGSCEFDVLSDADLLFVCDESMPRKQARRVAEQVVQALTLYTREGTVFAVDSRLRPHGESGELVVTPAQLRAYFATDAKPWEALTYLRLRYIAGDESVGEAALDAVERELLPAISRRPTLAGELALVRLKLESSNHCQNLKTGPGGVYDIDYIVGMVQIQLARPIAANFSERIKAACDSKVLDRNHAEVLERNACFLRSVEHAIRLATGNAGKWLPASDHARRAILELMQPAVADGEQLKQALESAMRENREIYSHYRHLE